MKRIKSNGGIMRSNKIVLGCTVLFFIMVILLLSNRPLRAEEDVVTNKIMNKLDTILENQQKMLQEMAYLKEELSIVKIRSTRK